MKFTVYHISSTAVLVALNIILGKISIGPSFASVNLGFIALIICGYLYGIRLTILTAVIANLLAFTIMGHGTFSILFIIPALLAGATYGILQKLTLWKIIVVNVVVVVGISFFINTHLIAYVYHLNYTALLSTRLFKMIASLIVQIIVTYFLLKQSAIKNFKTKLHIMTNRKLS
ncbi:folate family ECF transporter S component [Leuconostoc palmae]|uniref:folate family ECF transporter S component n=1 Tax=Leuconostoc palmae TaxID=501487 RepID=UPI001C7CE2FB|nr:folate family ECF transporter S component [Leuconostoc palmae]